MSESSGPRSDQDHASLAAARLLREVADYERRLRKLSTHESSGRQAYLVDAYRRAMRLRERLITELPRQPETPPCPWRTTRAG